MRSSRPDIGDPGIYATIKVGDTTVVGLRTCLDAMRTALRFGTLYDYAAQHEETRALSGRGIAYAVPLPNGERVVVRHNRHGGILASLTGDRFLAPTRAPYELETSLRLRELGVPTPEILAYVVYRAGPLLRRSDVASREIPGSADLAAILTRSSDDERRAALDAAALLIGLLSTSGARHHDLNVKNVLLARGASISVSSAAVSAYVLDVDRIEFRQPGDKRLIEGNLERFIRSARKWRRLHGARVDDVDLARLADSVRRFVASGSPRTRS